MADTRRLVVLGGPIHPDALALLETEARARCFACCAARKPEVLVNPAVWSRLGVPG